MDKALERQKFLDRGLYGDLKTQSEMDFDYEVETIKLDREENKVYFYDEKTEIQTLIDYDRYWDELMPLPIIKQKHDKEKKEKTKINYAWCLKRLVSKKKRRLETEHFDLDMSYITKRVIAMGYPSSGFEAIYRNNVRDVQRYFEVQHKNQVKVYNLCLEKDKIYPKTLFTSGVTVGLFPSKDHNPCPIKLILDLCVDITLYLIRYPKAVAAIHCKAGKGRTGVMICCYLIFSGLCKNSEDAMKHYSITRTYNGRGVTIPSQIKYIQYFEAFLVSNFSQPYYKMLPKMIKHYIDVNTKNIIQNFMNDPSYFIYPNKFYFNYIKVGPFDFPNEINVTIHDFTSKVIKYPHNMVKVEKINEYNRTAYYYKIILLDKIDIQSDMKIVVKGSGVKFYFWINQWYSTLDLIKTHVDQARHIDNNYFYLNTKDKEKSLLKETESDILDTTPLKSSIGSSGSAGSNFYRSSSKKKSKKGKPSFDLELTEITEEPLDTTTPKGKPDLIKAATVILEEEPSLKSSLRDNLLDHNEDENLESSRDMLSAEDKYSPDDIKFKDIEKKKSSTINYIDSLIQISKDNVRDSKVVEVTPEKKEKLERLRTRKSQFIEQSQFESLGDEFIKKKISSTTDFSPAIKIKRITKKTETMKRLEQFELKNSSSSSLLQINQKNDMESLNEIIDRLNYDKDLNSVVSVVNEVLAAENKKLFNIDDLDIYLSANELDKFHQHKKMMENFYVRINYSLQGKLG